MKYGVLLLSLISFGAAYGGLRAAISPSGAPAGVSAEDGAQIYGKQCASCHGRDGRAQTIKGKLKHARNLAEGEWQEKVSDERIFNSIMNGKGKMPAYSKKLSQEQVEALVTYVRALRK